MSSRRLGISLTQQWSNHGILMMFGFELAIFGKLTHQCIFTKCVTPFPFKNIHSSKCFCSTLQDKVVAHPRVRNTVIPQSECKHICCTSFKSSFPLKPLCIHRLWLVYLKADKLYKIALMYSKLHFYFFIISHPLLKVKVNFRNDNG